MKTINKLVYAFFLLAVLMVNAQDTPPDPGGGGGGTGPGVPSAPIDMYVYALGTVAVLLIAFFTKKYKNQKI
ncbi:signal peptidase [Chryseobacterium fluminis]|uniref:signal peptidase n=1 Tax=Chryseobacterium fluminis TaxID=2983606 RepID=UPI00224E9836|nr:signal peptidase [Chryseobacterium sp. MMS21-Ot14]UZT96922.1 signal peptidase [Chryseobacterium sp. MMS21-Ot14]